MNKYDIIIEKFVERFKQDEVEYEFSPASYFFGIRYLKKVKYPTDFITFYRRYEPQAYIEYNDIRLWNIRALKSENEDLVPGCLIFPLGFRVIGTTVCGDVLCVQSDDEKGVVYIASHSQRYDRLKDHEIKNGIIQISSSIDDFLEKYINKEIKSDYHEYKT